MAPGMSRVERALRALDRDAAVVDGDVDADGTGMGDLPMRDIGSYQT